jgi:hypothetical protein
MIVEKLKIDDNKFGNFVDKNNNCYKVVSVPKDSETLYKVGNIYELNEKKYEIVKQSKNLDNLVLLLKEKLPLDLFNLFSKKQEAKDALTDFILNSYIDGRISRHYYEKLKSYLVVLNS